MAYYMNNNRDIGCYRGDIFYIANSGHVVGSEQRSGRPGIIVSNDLANKHSPNVSVVYLTSQEKKPLPTHVDVIRIRREGRQCSLLSALFFFRSFCSVKSSSGPIKYLHHAPRFAGVLFFCSYPGEGVPISYTSTAGGSAAGGFFLPGVGWCRCFLWGIFKR